MRVLMYDKSDDSLQVHEIVDAYYDGDMFNDIDSGAFPIVGGLVLTDPDGNNFGFPHMRKDTSDKLVRELFRTGVLDLADREDCMFLSEDDIAEFCSSIENVSVARMDSFEG